MSETMDEQTARETLARRLAAAADDGRLNCAAAMRLAEESGVAPQELGAAADAAGVRIRRCQLGLFGYGQPHTPSDKSLAGGEPAPESLARLIEPHRDGRLPCAAAWAIAREAGVTRLQVGRAAEAANVHIVACQLGCF